MWRGLRCLRPLLLGLASGEAPGAARRPARAIASAPRSLSFLGSRELSSLGRPEQVEAEAGAEQAGFQAEEEGNEQEQLARPDPGPSRFGFEDIVSFLRQENAKDICAIQLPPEMRYSSYFVIVSGSSPRHLHAMAQYLIKMFKHLKTDCEPHVVIEGKDTDDWLCIDFGHTVVHFMLPETREIYELEKLWTLRSYDDQLAQMIPESIPENFILGMNSEQEELAST
nr:mitochondrial assembly of ribosomal large subunit protein 1 [Anolis sagrei ordinatus]